MLGNKRRFPFSNKPVEGAAKMERRVLQHERIFHWTTTTMNKCMRGFCFHNLDCIISAQILEVLVASALSCSFCSTLMGLHLREWDDNFTASNLSAQIQENVIFPQVFFNRDCRASFDLVLLLTSLIFLLLSLFLLFFQTAGLIPFLTRKQQTVASEGCLLAAILWSWLPQAQWRCRSTHYILVECVRAETAGSRFVLLHSQHEKVHWVVPPSWLYNQRVVINTIHPLSIQAAAEHLQQFTRYSTLISMSIIHASNWKDD